MGCTLNGPTMTEWKDFWKSEEGGGGDRAERVRKEGKGVEDE